MNKLDELSSFPELEGHIPCIICKGESSHTIVGKHWKCSICGHLFNEDGSKIDLPVPCQCDNCNEKVEDEVLDKQKGFQATLKKVQRKVKRLSKKK
jgi:ribosomal protein L37AE/L43A